MSLNQFPNFFKHSYTNKYILLWHEINLKLSYRELLCGDNYTIETNFIADCNLFLGHKKIHPKLKQTAEIIHNALHNMKMHSDKKGKYFFKLRNFKNSEDNRNFNSACKQIYELIFLLFLKFLGKTQSHKNLLLTN